MIVGDLFDEFSQDTEFLTWYLDNHYNNRHCDEDSNIFAGAWIGWKAATDHIDKGYNDLVSAGCFADIVKLVKSRLAKRRTP